MCSLRFLGCLLFLCGLSAHAAEPSFFEAKVAPILQRRCLSCHNDAEHKGDFSLQTAKAALDSGHIEPGDPAGSNLLDAIKPAKGQVKMPKDADPLSAEHIAAIEKWIADGAVWPAGVTLTEPAVTDLNWWSLRPIARPVVPVPAENSIDPDWPITPIDAFVLAEMHKQGLSPSPPADRRTLIRRLYFDLIGLPPSPEEIDAFAADERPDAYERLVDRLLASPGYGERWARHWLDVVHYADTHGYDKDKLRPNAWPYRDYVIRAFNDDKPYERFVREQIAGDVLFPDTPDGITATGFIAAGPWDFIGHAEVPETKIDGRIARHLDRDDMVVSTMNTFVSLTVQCAQCHNHKFDPIKQEHYYSLQAVFAALDRADRPFDASPEIARRRVELKQRLADAETRHAALLAAMDKAGGEPLARLDEQIRNLQKQNQAAADRTAAFGYHSQIMPTAEQEKWVQVDLGRSMPIRYLVYVGCHDDFNNIGHGFGFPARYKIEVSDDAAFAAGVKTVVDHTAADVPNPGTKPQSVKLEDIAGRYVRVTATKLAPRQNDFIFALAELSVIDAAGRNAAFGRPVTSLDSIEAPVRWTRSNLVDGYYFGVTASPETLAAIAELNEQRRELLARSLDPKLQAELQAAETDLKTTREQLAALPPQQTVYVGTVHNGSGAFTGTGPSGGRPREIRLLHRGNILAPGPVMSPGTVPIIAGRDGRFSLPPGHSEGARRVALADWLVAADQPLTWRSIVNRVWQYHFGRGIVDSPNDFGRMGKLPTHPELLDWLAAEFRDGGQSLKSLHRLIVTSAVYRQSSAHDEAKAAIDADNRFLWRMNRRRLEAEELRDAVLQVSGRLRGAMYGPAFQAFVIDKPEHSPHYEYDRHDPNDPATHRRSIYRFIVRSQPDPFMNTLDCADSSQSVPKRDETLTALQALTLLNNPFMLAMSRHFSDRVAAEPGGVPAQVRAAFRLATGRDPTADQQRALESFAAEFGLPAACRLIVNLNEFVFVD